MIYDVIIIGAGPAGMSAGIYICRKQLSALILSKDLGGQMARSWEIENYIGYNLISGANLAQKFKDHLEGFECLELKTGQNVVGIKKKNKIFSVKVFDGQVFESKTVIIATGKVPKILGVKGENELRGHGVTYCATCDAPFFKNKIVAVIGDGNSALGAAYQLAKIAQKVYLVFKTKNFRDDIDGILKKNVLSFKNVEVIFNSTVTEIFGDTHVLGLEYRDKNFEENKKIDLQGVFIEIGSTPSLDFAKRILKINKSGEIIIDKRNMTSISGIFAAGDVTDIFEKQIIIAAGEGAKAAISVSRYISGEK